ncbi:MAG: PQQ-like domain [Verrucomicrobia bacterium]|jgi:outer membrane protein assembly factor BamB|nr:PQQ-like domain [Verrucomicrobiota bacterium]
MSRILPTLLAALLCGSTLQAEVTGGSFVVHFERTFRGLTTILAATDQFLFVSDAGPAPDDQRPVQSARQADDGTILGYSPLGRQSIVRLLVCKRATGEIVHEFAGPVSRRPRVSGFELPLTSPPLLLDDGFTFLTADWHLQRIQLPVNAPKPKQIWALDIPTATKLTPRLNDDIGYLMPALTRCGDTLLFTFNSAPAGAQSPLSLTLVAVNLIDGKLRWVRNLGPGGALDRSPTCLPLSPEKFAVVTAQGEVQTYSLAGELLHSLRAAADYQPSEPGWHWGGDTWELFRLDQSRIAAFGGRHAERGKTQDYPLCALRVGADGRLEKQWQSNIPLGSIATLALGTNLYQRSLSTHLTAFSPKTGQKLWSTPALESPPWTAPIVHDGFIYLTTYEGLQVYRDGPEAKLLGTVQFTDMPSHYSPPVIHSGNLYIGAGERIYALKLPLFTSTSRPETK